MPIVFNCPGCQQQLRVADSAAGKKAKCPQCNTVVAVPAASPPANPFQPTPADGPPPGALPPVQPGGPVNPYVSPITGGERQYDPFAAPGGKIGHRPLDVGEVVSFAWQVWKDNLGLLVGGFLVLAIINIGVSAPFGIMRASLERQREMESALAVGFLGNVISQIVGIYLGIGFSQMCLCMARGQRADFAQIFGGGSRFLPVLGVSILLGLAIMAGTMACIVPGILLALMWWPAYYLVVDKKAGVFEAFSVASQITKNNWGAAFALWFVSFGIALLGLLALCVGILFAAPLVTMIWICAYLLMSDQIRPPKPA
jgi:uncharacterized membrane protein